MTHRALGSGPRSRALAELKRSAGLSDVLDLSAIGLRTPLGAAGFWAAAIAGLALAFAATVAYYFVVSSPRHASAKEAGIRKTVTGT